MIKYDDIIKNSPFLVNHLISLKKTHDFYINKYIEKTDIPNTVTFVMDSLRDIMAIL